MTSSKKTLDALGRRYPKNKLIENKGVVPDGEFLRQLRRSRVLLVPEMEEFKRENLNAAIRERGKGPNQWGETFRAFLRRGGNIVFLSPTGDALNFFNESGLGPLKSGGSSGGWEITPAGKKLGAKVGGVVANVNATHYYKKAAPWTAWGAPKDGNGAVVVGRRLERGWVMVFGADFYENERCRHRNTRPIDRVSRPQIVRCSSAAECGDGATTFPAYVDSLLASGFGGDVASLG